MTDDLTSLEDWTSALLNRLQPPERRRLTRTVATELRRSQRQRIAQQREPDGTPFEPRKPQKNLRGKTGRVRRTMFSRLRTSKYMKAASDANSATVQFVGRTARIARIHQLGLRAEVNKDGPSVDYPERRLLGLTDSDRQRVMDQLLKHLSSDV